MKWEHVQDSEQKHRVKIGETSIRATTWVRWAFDDEPVRGSVNFGDAQAEEEYYARFERGDLANIIIQVHATWQDAEGADIMGGCHVETKHGISHAALELANDQGMRMEALKQLQELVISRAKLYKFKGI